MSPWSGWGLAFAALGAGWFGYGWRGVALASTVTVFWLLLQFSRSVRVMRMAAASPVGSVPSAVMLHSRLQAGLTMSKIVMLTRSLGRRLEGAPETWSWSDASGAEVQVVFERGRCGHWVLTRPAEA